MLEYVKSLASMMPFDNGVLVYSFWSGYRENQEMKEFLTECESLGLKIVTLHTSGHADIEAIRRLVEITNPNVLIPIHTEVPQNMVFDGVKTLIATGDKIISINNLSMEDDHGTSN